jgi:hypothetical protein
VSYGVKPIHLTASATSGLPVTLSLISGPAKLSGNILTVTGAGTVVIAANQSGNTEYGPAPEVRHSITVSKTAQTITFPAPKSPVTYGVKPVALTASASSGLAVSFALVSGPGKLSNGVLTVTGAGSIVVAASQAGNADYLAATAVKHTIVVSKAVQTLNFPTLRGPFTYGEKPLPLAAKTTSGLAVSFSVLSGPGKITGGELAFTGAGTVIVEASQPGNLDYLAAAPAKQTLAVNKAKLTVTANNLSMKQGGAVPALTYSMTGFVNSDTQKSATSGAPKLTTAVTSNTKPGAYPITVAAGTLASPNYDFAFAGATLTVQP